MLVVTPRELDSVIAHGAALLGAAINRALQPRLSIAQLCWLVGSRVAKSISASATLGPVSYTHLDVYKRQLSDPEGEVETEKSWPLR